MYVAFLALVSAIFVHIGPGPPWVIFFARIVCFLLFDMMEVSVLAILAFLSHGLEQHQNTHLTAL